MERLTEWGESRQPEIKKGCGWDVADKLYDYENTGLEPAEVWQLRHTFEMIMGSMDMLFRVQGSENQEKEQLIKDRRRSGFTSRTEE